MQVYSIWFTASQSAATSSTTVVTVTCWLSTWSTESQIGRFTKALHKFILCLHVYMFSHIRWVWAGTWRCWRASTQPSRLSQHPSIHVTRGTGESPDLPSMQSSQTGSTAEWLCYPRLSTPLTQHQYPEANTQPKFIKEHDIYDAGKTVQLW